jgi:hypothetical protein
VEQYLAAGMDSHVAKPIEAAALFAALVRAWRLEARDGAPRRGEPGRSETRLASEGRDAQLSSATTRTSSTILRRIAGSWMRGNAAISSCPRWRA